jgi:chemotaxis protein methyltransferase CheR
MAFTFFFRDFHTLQLIAEHVIPHLLGSQRVHIWDAGCAHGPEPYSLAILLRENMGDFLFRNVRIAATDLNAEFGKVIAAGTYPEEQVKRIPEDLLARYFNPVAPGWYELVDPIRRAVEFCHHDLTTLEPIRTGLGLVMCKNVLLHLSEAERIAVISMFHRALAPGGFLVMEQTQKLPSQVSHLFTRVTEDGQVFRQEGG